MTGANRACVVLILAASALAPSAAATAAADDVLSVPRGDYDPATFASLGDAERLSFVLSVLELRDRAVRNLSCKVVETSTNNDPNYGRVTGGYKNLEFRRLGEKYWVRRAHYVYSNDGPVLREVWLANWDGRASRLVPGSETADLRSAVCTIHPSEDFSIAWDYYTVLLGFRMGTGQDRVMSVTNWVRDVSRRGQELHISDEELKGRHAIRLDVRERPERRALWLDPARGFLIEQYEQSYDDGSRFGGEVRAAEQVSGLWLPRRIVFLSSIPASKVITELAYEISDVRLGQIAEKDVRLDIPKDAQVLDMVGNIAYRSLPSGKFKLLPMTDAGGFVHQPPADSVVDHIDDKTAKLYTIGNSPVPAR